jgi:1-deoxy-D-xylulose-5-phosphate synthase
VPTIDMERAAVECAKGEVLSWSDDGVILSFGALLPACLEAAHMLREEGMEVGVVNARFVKPLDTALVLRAVRECGFVVTVEEAALMTGFGSAVLETANDAGLDTSRVRRLGIPDQFIEHADRGELLADLGLDATGIAAACRSLAKGIIGRAALPVE